MVAVIGTEFVYIIEEHLDSEYVSAPFSFWDTAEDALWEYAEFAWSGRGGLKCTAWINVYRLNVPYREWEQGDDTDERALQEAIDKAIKFNIKTPVK